MLICFSNCSFVCSIALWYTSICRGKNVSSHASFSTRSWMKRIACSRSISTEASPSSRSLNQAFVHQRMPARSG